MARFLLATDDWYQRNAKAGVSSKTDPLFLGSAPTKGHIQITTLEQYESLHSPHILHRESIPKTF